MSGSHRHHRTSRAQISAGLALLCAAILIGCTHGDPKYRPGTLPPLSPSETPSDSVTPTQTPSGTQGISDKDQVNAVYLGFLKNYPEAQDVPKARRRLYLSRWMTEPGLSSMVKGINDEVAQHQRNVGGFVPHIMSIRVSGTTATVNDCMDQSKFDVKDTRTGKIVSSGPDHVWTVVYMKKTPDGWRVSHPTWKHRSCKGR